jgi:DNA-binding NarL/FixJ family response regulator
MDTGIKMANQILKTLEIDALTGEVIERALTADEIAERKTMQAEADARQAESDAKIAARESALAKLAALGLTADEIAAL